jgi:Holliday junction DNA helicase RuvA
MIAMLRGRLVRSDGDHLIIDCQGVGYGVQVATSTRADLPRVGEEVTLYTYLQVREDALQLFGFLTWEDKEAFEALLTVSGVGPKLALAVLSALPARELVLAVAAGDEALLSSISGIGKKTAQRIILELREKMGAVAREGRAGATLGMPESAAAGKDPVSDAVAALMVLGYTAVEAGRSVQKAREAGAAEVPGLIREALKLLG